jgi:hypothetical protein
VGGEGGGRRALGGAGVGLGRGFGGPATNSEAASAWLSTSAGSLCSALGSVPKKSAASGRRRRPPGSKTALWADGRGSARAAVALGGGRKHGRLSRTSALPYWRGQVCLSHAPWSCWRQSLHTWYSINFDVAGLLLG